MMNAHSEASMIKQLIRDQGARDVVVGDLVDVISC